MSDWSGQIYVNEGHGRLYHGMTKVRHDGVQEALQGKRRVITNTADNVSELNRENEWWRESRRDDGREVKLQPDKTVPMSLFKVSEIAFQNY